MSIQKFFQNHLTKVIGFTQVTLGALTVMDPVILTGWFGPRGPSYVIAFAGLLTAWRGFASTAFYNREVLPMPEVTKQSS